ncbi:MAG: hypothetical protein EOO89_17930, partial [Pedobacter sp.]
MNRIIYLMVMCLTTSTAFALKTDTSRFSAVFREVQKNHAPDKRSVYFQINYKGDSAFVESSSSEAISAFKEALLGNNEYKFSAMVLPDGRLNGMTHGLTNVSVSNNRAAPQNAA